MKFKKSLLGAMLLFVANVAMAQMMPTLPVDKDVTIGKLDNGLTYYIRHNNWPENRAEFYIAQRVGSIQENDDQRGLAHFLEHMCFNGTDNFKGNEVLRWCESIGVKFGVDLNAYTSIDRTVYNISNVPTERQSALDSCLLILHDWADGLTLDPAEIDKERGVIHEEWRLRTSPQMRMLERCLPKLYPGSKYGLRMPIGLMEVVDNFKPQTLRDYYEKWYRPDNQAVIVVGNVDVAYIEKKIKELFGGIKMPENPAPVVDELVPDNAEPIYIIEKDKEQQRNGVSLMIKHEVFPDSLKNTMAFLMQNYMKRVSMSMLNARLSEYAQKADCPFVSAYASDGTYLFSKTMDALSLDADPKDGQIEASLGAVMREARRAAEFGFTATEFQRAKSNIESQLDKIYSNKDKRYSSQFVDEYVENYLKQDPIPSLDDEYAMMKQIIPALPLEYINMYMKELVPENDSNMVVLTMLNEKEGNVYPTEASLKKAIDDVRAEKLEAYVDNVKDEPLMTVMPKKGSIKKEVASDKFGYKTLTLSNGAQVILKQTDYKKDQVILSGEGFGGSSLYGEKDFTNAQVFDDVIEASGLGNFSHTELEKALAGKIASASLSLGETYTNISGSSTPKDLETLFQLVHLYFTNIKKDQESYDNFMNTLQLQLKNKALSPDQALSDSITCTLYGHNPRTKPLDTTILPQINYDRILQMAKERTANAAAFTFTIIGNYDEATIRPLIEQYIASLPAQKKVVKGKRVTDIVDGKVVNSFKRKMETPKATSIMVWTNKSMPYTLENAVKADIAGQVLNMIYLKKIREDASAAYSCGASGGAQRQDDFKIIMLQAYCPMKPEKGDIALQIMSEEVPALAKSCDADMLKKVKEYMVKNIDDQSKTNGYWAGAITRYRKYGLDFFTDYKSVVEAQTPETICQFMQEFLKDGNKIEVTMMPEE
ncbi:MAG: insulinase family protein [Prevotella sp.]|nr:insulinase family protein [Prevotella sp.]